MAAPDGVDERSEAVFAAGIEPIATKFGLK